MQMYTVISLKLSMHEIIRVLTERSKTMKTIKLIALILVIIGGLNCLLVGLFKFNLVTAIFGDSVVTTIVYVLVGLSALISLTLIKDINDSTTV